ncbi:hypothetical protein ACP4OV_017079 [Aristida adscensionis]
MATVDAEHASASRSSCREAPPATFLGPDLFMAARRGDGRRLSELLRLNGGEQQGGAVDDAAAAVPTAAPPQQVVVKVVDAQRLSLLSAAAAAPRSGAASTLSLLDGVTAVEGDSLLHVLAGAGDGEDFRRCAEMIYHGNRRLLAARNGRGDTPLHCAAGAGHAGMVSCLVALAIADGAEAAGAEAAAVKRFVRARNERGETALHRAVRAGSKAAMDELMSVDSELACVPRDGEEGAPATASSPLYLAISLGKEDIARHLIQRSGGKLSCSGPDGRNVLHAAVSRGQALPMLFELLKGVTVNVQQGDRHMSSVPLLSQLTTQQDKDGSTPLHLVASLEGWRFAQLLSKSFQRVWPQPKSTTTLLLDASTCSVYQPDNDGLYPIHVAAMNGSRVVIETLIERCPDCVTLRDAKGRTLLHVAAEWEGLDWISRFKVVEYACREPKLSSVLNMQDNNGDTVLHRAVDAGNVANVNCLIRNREVDLGITNKDDLTPLDLSRSKIPPKFYYRWNPRFVILTTLLLVGAPCGGNRVDLFRKRHLLTKIDEDKESRDLTSAAHIMGIVSVLIATVTYASAFTLPGGYYQSASDGGVPGTPILAGSYAFRAFILADVLAFTFSALATFSLLFAGLPAMERSVRFKYFSLSTFLVHASGRTWIAGFAMGLYVVLAPVAHTFAVAVCVISFAALLYGNREVWQLVCAVDVARERLGFRALVRGGILLRMPVHWHWYTSGP